MMFNTTNTAHAMPFASAANVDTEHECVANALHGDYDYLDHEALNWSLLIPVTSLIVLVVVGLPVILATLF